MYFFKRKNKNTSIDGKTERYLNGEIDDTPIKPWKPWTGDDGNPPSPCVSLKDMSPEKQAEMYRLYGNGPSRKRGVE